MKATYWIESGILAIGLIVMGVCVKKGLSTISANTRTVYVKGLAEREVKADHVTWPIVLKLVGNDLGTIYENVNANNEIVKKFLTSKGIKEDEISISAPSVTDKATNQYGDEEYKERYNVTSVITVSTTNVDLVKQLVTEQGELLTQGVAIASDDYESTINYEFTGLNKIKPDMIKEATENARKAGEQFAKDSQSKLGKIKEATQGQFEIYDRDNYTPYIKTVRVVTTLDYYLDD